MTICRVGNHEGLGESCTKCGRSLGKPLEFYECDMENIMQYVKDAVAQGPPKTWRDSAKYWAVMGVIGVLMFFVWVGGE